MVDLPVPELTSPKPSAVTAEQIAAQEKEYARAAVAAVNKMDPAPAFCVVCGDLTNAYPDKNGEERAKEVKDFKEVFMEMRDDVPVS